MVERGRTVILTTATWCQVGGVGCGAASGCEDLRSVIQVLAENVVCANRDSPSNANRAIDLDAVVVGIGVVAAGVHYAPGWVLAKACGSCAVVVLLVGEQLFSAVSDIGDVENGALGELLFNAEVVLISLRIHHVLINAGYRSPTCENCGIERIQICRNGDGAAFRGLLK